jgi:hypothetical protein
MPRIQQQNNQTMVVRGCLVVNEWLEIRTAAGPKTVSLEAGYIAGRATPLLGQLLGRFNWFFGPPRA